MKTSAKGTRAGERILCKNCFCLQGAQEWHVIPVKSTHVNHLITVNL